MAGTKGTTGISSRSVHTHATFTMSNRCKGIGMKRMLIGALAATLCSLSISQAQNAHHMSDMKNMPGMKDMQAMQGMHRMEGTVSALDGKTGRMEVHADGMTLKLHFPPVSLADVKVGDKIEVALSFRKLPH